MKRDNETKELREALEKILKAFASTGATAVFTMANIARDALKKTEAES